jgi:hypothetical protein
LTKTLYDSQPHTQANQELNLTGSKPIGARERTM